MAHVQVRNVPPELHALLKRRAASAGLSLNEFLLHELRRIGESPTVAEVVRRAEERGLVDFASTSASLLREEREAR